MDGPLEIALASMVGLLGVLLIGSLVSNRRLRREVGVLRAGGLDTGSLRSPGSTNESTPGSTNESTRGTTDERYARPAFEGADGLHTALVPRAGSTNEYMPDSSDVTVAGATDGNLSVVEPVAQRPSRDPVPDVVITDLGEASDVEATEPRGERRLLFAGPVLGEAVVKAASFTHGVRRALTPENRNRIRFVMKQEVKRSRKQRKAEIREARRYLAEQRRRRGTAEDAA